MRCKYKYTDELLGEMYGDWVVVGNGDKKGFIKCKCTCGFCDEVIRDVDAGNLLVGKSNGCGRKHRSKNGKNNKRTNTYILNGEYGIGCTRCGYEFYFDLEDYDRIKDYCWHKHKDGYLRTRIDVVDGKNVYILLHNLIKEKLNKENNIDHINGKPYDNRKENLRECSHCQNMKNVKLSISNKSGVKGVHYSTREEKWKAYITHDNEKIHLGTFINKEDAIAARINKEKELFGEYIRSDIEYGELYNTTSA